MKKILLSVLLLFFSTYTYAGYIGLKTINTNNDYTQWFSDTPLETISENEQIVTNNQYYWRDESNDDKGDGNYIYPTDASFGANTADIEQFRVCWDTTNVYFLVKLANGTGSYDRSAFFYRD